MTTLLHAYKPEHGFLDSLADCKKAVVEEKRSLFLTKTLCDVAAFFLDKDDAVKRFVEDMILKYTSAAASGSSYENIGIPTLWKAQESCVIVSNFLPKAQKLRP